VSSKELNTKKWGEFTIGEQFQVEKCRPFDIEFFDELGDTPYVTRTTQNNSVLMSVKTDELTNKGNCITVGGETAYFAYQKKDFIAGTNITKIYNDHLNVYNALFIVTVANANRYRFSYGRALNFTQTKRLTIKLPVNSHGSPDWFFMEQYIKSLGAKPIKTSIKAKISPLKPMHDWREFLLGDLFTFYKGKRLTKDDMIEGQINYLGAINDNNSIRQLIDIEPMFQPDCITVNYNGSVGEAFYQSRPFWASDDVNILYPKDWLLSKYIALFITTVIKANRYRFSYGRKWTMEKMKQSIIKLPATPDGTPDWEYMENYIKSLPYSDRI